MVFLFGCGLSAFGVTSPEGSTWSQRDEAEYSQWVQKIGESNCHTPARCLNSPANYLRTPDDSSFIAGLSIDCGRLPILLRGYFAVKKRLPFTAATDVEANGSSSDLRYSRNGNSVRTRKWITAVTANPLDALASIIDDTDSSRQRIPIGNNDNDYYPIKIDAQTLIPGTVFYDTNGHVAVVYKVVDGRILTLNSHPDNSIDSKPFTSDNFAWDRNPVHGGGFKKFRPIVVTGSLRLTQNSEIPDYSTEQFSHTTSDYYGFVIAQLGAKMDIEKRFSQDLADVCEKFRDRTNSVQASAQSGITQKSLSQLPRNIYGADGDWETYSSPSGDMRLNAQLARIYHETATSIEMTETNNPAAGRWQGNPAGFRKFLAQTFVATERTEGCNFSYKNSSGLSRQLSLRDVFARGFRYSFDPYHCIELRMGATVGSDEFRSCMSNSTKLRWYEAEQTLRNRLEKDTSLFTGYDLDGLIAHAKDLGPSQSAPTNILELF